MSIQRKLIRTRRYVEYIAHAESHGAENPLHLAWAYYQLELLPELGRMVKSHALPPPHAACFRVLYHAATGNHAGFQAAMAEFLSNTCPVKPKTYYMVAQKIAEFAPQEALELLMRSGYRAPELETSLLKALGKALDVSLPAALHNVRAHPAMLLADGIDDTTRLTLLNALLDRFNLSPVAYRHAEVGFQFTNLTSSVTPSQYQGPQVSVIMTTYNGGHKLCCAVESLLRQSYAAIEIIVVDDASQGNPLNPLQALATYGKTLKLVRLPTNVGTYRAKLAGLQHASSDYIMCHDDDDWSHPWRVQLQMAPLIQHRQLIATTSNWIRFDPNGRPYARKRYPLMRLNPSSMLFRRQPVITHCGTWDGARTGADSEFNQRVGLVFGPRAIKQLRLPLAFGLHHGGSLMNAPATGYSSQQGAKQRQQYSRAWTRWHIACVKHGTQPYMKN